MNWTRALVAGVVGGIVMWIADFLLHGFVMAGTYVKYPEVFTQEQSNPLLFLVIEILIGIPAAIIFAKTRRSWAEGVKGGLSFGFWIGLLGFFPQFFNSLVIKDFPYFLSWCWGGITLIVALILGIVLGLIIKKT
jgi:hypothetical protein